MTESHPFISRGREIIKDVLREHMLHADDFFGTLRHRHLVKARRAAALRLRDAGYSCTQSARMMKRNHTTVLNYLDKMPEAKRKRRLFKLLTRNLADDVHHAVVEIAKTEGVSLEVLVAQWVTERTRYEIEAKRRTEGWDTLHVPQRSEKAPLDMVAA